MRKTLIISTFTLVLAVVIYVVMSQIPVKSVLGHYEFDAQNITAEKIANKVRLDQVGQNELKEVLQDLEQNFHVHLPGFFLEFQYMAVIKMGPSYHILFSDSEVRAKTTYFKDAEGGSQVEITMVNQGPVLRFWIEKDGGYNLGYSNPLGTYIPMNKEVDWYQNMKTSDFYTFVPEK